MSGKVIESPGKVFDLLRSAKRDGINILLNNGELQVKVSKGRSIDPTILQQIKDNKEAIINFLNNNSWKSSKVDAFENELQFVDRSSVTHLPLSYAQERLWFIDQLEGSVQYHMPAVLRIKGQVNVDALSYSLQQIVARHEVLRTVIRQQDGQGYQHILSENGWHLNITESSQYKDDRKGLGEYIQQLVNKPFDLSNDWMLRADLIRLEDEQHVLVVTMHHIASDGWSISILVKELVELYSSVLENRQANLSPLTIQYADYALWQRRYLQGDVLESKLHYWQQKLQGVEPLQMPTDFTRPAIQSTKGAVRTFAIDKALADKLQLLSQQEGSTLFMTLLAAFKVLLYRYSGQQDISVGTPMAGRQQQELEGLIGFFVNTLALRTAVKGDASFKELLQQVKITTLEAYHHQEVPFEKVVETVLKQRDLSRSPLFQVMFILQNTPDVPQLKLGDVQLSSEASEHVASRYDLTFFVNETLQGLQASVEYATALYSEETIAQVIAHYKTLLQSIVANPQQKIGFLPMLSKEEEKELLIDFNQTQAAYPKDKTIIDLFEEQAAKTPQATAIVFEGKHLTYQQLNERANQLGHYLRSKGVQHETLVPICIERSLEMIVGILGILKAGATYVPIDPEYPAERISYMLHDTAARVVVTSSRSINTLKALTQVEYIKIDSEEAFADHQQRNLNITVSPLQLAYVIYTSGSTGKPKGVMIEHASLLNLLISITSKVSFKSSSSFLAVTTYSFDISYLELFTPLINGGKLIIVSRDTTMDGYSLATTLSSYGPTHMQGTPSVWQLLLDAGWVNNENVKILVGGEALREDIKDQLTAIGDVWNLYGPTETTIWSTYKALDKNEKVVIGRPLANTSIHIVDSFGNLVPVGASGEICIGGDGLARGYLHRAELTAEKFIDNPFGVGSLRLYRTGDVGRWLRNGDIECFGRIDDQVKIRGYRIELGEIETLLLQHRSVNEAVVVAKEDSNGSKQLIGYIVSEAFNKEEIIAYLKSALPEYMVPLLWVPLAALPLTPNGKIDRKSLPEVDISGLLSHQYVAPRNAVEEQLAQIWQQLLGVEVVGIHDDFFELGGHSLKSLQIVAAIRRQLQVEVNIKELFTHRTIGQLSAHLSGQEGAALLPMIEQQERPAHLPLSYSQERLWFIDQLEGSVEYHSPAALRLRGVVDETALERSFAAIVDRHEVLRTVYVQEEGKPYQQVKEAGGWRLTLSDHGEEGLQGYVEDIIKKPFNLSADYMLRAELIRVSEGDQVLVVVMHHIASDAWSMPIIIKEVGELYGAYSEGREALLTPLKLQYADYALWQRNYLSAEILEEKISYWKNKLQGVQPLQLPTDYKRPAVRSTAGAAAYFQVDKGLSVQLHRLSQQHGATLFMTLLSAFKVLLYRYSGQQDISVGTSIANRSQQEVEGLIGFFVNTLTFRDEVSGNVPFTELLQQVKATTLGAYEHQEVPFERVVEAVVKERDASYNPLFQVMLVLQNTPEAPRLQLGKLSVSAEGYEHTISKFDLTFFINDTPGGLQGVVQYRTDLFKAETIERMMGHYSRLLSSISADAGQKVGSLPMLSDGEQRQLLDTGSAVSYSEGQTIAGLFEAQAHRTPDAVALVFEGEELSFSELNARANGVAHYLRGRGIQEDMLVPLCIERSSAMIIAMLGILKAGAAYVPIDTDFPAERISYMLSDSGSALVLSSKASRRKIETADIEIDIVEIDGNALTGGPGSEVSTALQRHHLAYVIYTSGSSGQPKGVMVTHGNLVDYVYGLNEKIQVEACRSYALVSSIATDLGNTVIYSWLVYGGALHVFSKEQVSNVGYVQRYFSDHTIDCVKIVPSHWKALSQDEELLLPKKLLIFGGEALPSVLVEDIRQAGAACTIINHYGPTETTIGKLLHKTEANKSYNNTIPIGKPFGNTQVYVLSKDMQLSAVGVPGQLYIGGAGVARGYLNNEGLTKEKFIADPFKGQGFMYATGDVVKYLEGGDIEFIGRADGQVKIRGYRVEVGEIESLLQQSGLVRHGVVVAADDQQGNKRLTGYVVAEGWYDREGILGYLKERLPEYMIPSVLIELEAMPLLPNGKVDRRQLPDADEAVGDQLAGQYVSPRNEAERKLAGIWQEVLEVEQVGMNDDFFELGGHSLLAVRLISAIRKAFEVEIPISHVFDYPTVGQLAEQLQTEAASTASVLPAIAAVHPRPQQIPLSFSQERLWFIDRLEGSVQYHVPAVLRLQGYVNKEALGQALQTIVNRHEVLRTVIKEKDGQPYQHIQDEDGWKLQLIEGSRYKADSKVLEQYTAELINKPFDLSADYMIRAHLIMLDEAENVLVVTLHHIASDGWSRSILVKELVELYRSYDENTQAQLPQLEIQYSDYAIWQRNYLQGEVLESKLQYWKNKLQDVEPLQMATDFVRPPVQSTKGAWTLFTIDSKLTGQLQQLSQQEGATLFMTLLAAFKVLLYRYTNQKDITVGTGVAGRQQSELENLIGFFINMLTLRSEVNADETFSDLLNQVRTTTIEAYDHQEVPFEKVVEAVVTERDASRTPLFQALFVLRNTPDVPELEIGKVQLSMETSINETAKYDLTFYVTETSTGLECAIEYSKQLFKSETIQRMAMHFKQLLFAIVQSPAQHIGTLQMLSQEEQQLITKFNETDAPYPGNDTLVSLFQKQVEQTPNNIALIFEDTEYSYQQLNEYSNQVAHYLQQCGVGQETLVPICLPRSADIVIGILGILKAGGAYVPIDPEYPAARIGYMLQETNASIIITSKEIASALQLPSTLKVLEISDDWLKTNNSSKNDLPINLNSKNLAYVIYTSGSTGTPKGVMVEHGGVVNLVSWHISEYEVNAGSKATAMAGVGFDAFGWEVWPYLLTGASICIVNNNERLSTKDLMQIFEKQHITHSFVSTAMMEDFVHASKNLTNLKYVLTGGDKLPALNLKDVNYSVVNNYGPTEYTVVATNYKLSKQDGETAPPIGKPISNSSIYILNQVGGLAPLNVFGEICISGAGLARGYLYNEELTSSKFVDISVGEKKLRAYKTGDLGRWLPNGNIEYGGRIDDQVKIRGNRIELGEIENVLLQHEQVKHAVVVIHQFENDDKILVAYVVSSSSFDKQELTIYLKSKLPDYMVPAVWVQLESLPLTANGKIDKKKLPKPTASANVENYAAPQTDLQIKLTDIWKELLNRQQIGINDNFFELGGHSLLVMRMVADIERILAISIPISVLFQFTSISELSKYMELQLFKTSPQENITTFELIDV